LGIIHKPSLLSHIVLNDIGGLSLWYGLSIYPMCENDVTVFAILDESFGAGENQPSFSSRPLRLRARRSTVYRGTDTTTAMMALMPEVTNLVARAVRTVPISLPMSRPSAKLLPR